MKLYADAPGHRTRQILADVLLLLWVWLWVRVGLAVHDATLALAVPGEQIERAGSGLAGRLRDAGSSVGKIPLVGEEVRTPFDGAGDAADGIAAAGAAQAEAVGTLADWLGLAVAAIPILVVAAVYLPLRWRFVRAATAGRRLVDSGGDVDLFALRAMSHQPLHRLARISGDPAGAWRRGDADVVRALAELELRDVGLMPARLPAVREAKP
ncbi:MAG: hypothetical protein ACLGH4_06780 [Actinomycetes bacterium]